VHVIVEALRILHAAHERHAREASAPDSIAHGLSLKSVVVGYDGRVTVDFGTSRDSVDRISTTDGVFQGKLGYAAPEQVQGLPGGRRADVFATGVLLWEVIALRRFTPKERTRAAVEARISGFEPRIQAVMPEVDPALAAICDRAMHVNPESRYATADELRLALVAYAQAHFPAVRVRLVGEAMRALFVRENAAARRPVDATEESTTVGDLSLLIQSTVAKDSVPPPATTPEPPRAQSSVPPSAFEEEPADEPPNHRPLIITLAAVIVAVGTFFFSMSRQAQAPADVPSSPAAQAESTGLLPATTMAAADPAPSPAEPRAEEPAAAGGSAVMVTDASQQPAKPASTRPRLAPNVKPRGAKAPLQNVHGLDEEDPFK
jgi:serine/threonine protein kinase